MVLDLQLSCSPKRRTLYPHPKPQSSARGDIEGLAVAEQSLQPRWLHGPGFSPVPLLCCLCCLLLK